MPFGYVAPLERAFDRMRRVLFSPFRLETWLVLGFAAFLDGLAEGGWGGGRVFKHVFEEESTGRARDLAHRVAELLREPLWLALGIAAACALIVLAVVFLWLSSRGKFVFLDSLVRERAAIVEPWRRFRELGNSLFLWRLGFAVISLVCAVLLAVPVALAAAAAGSRTWPIGLVLFAAVFVLVLLAFGLAVGFVHLLLDNFVVPLMYRHGLTTTEAWRRFLPLLGSHALRFVLYALLLFVLLIGVVVVVVTFGLLTCCCGFLILAIPYVGSVIVLPLSATYRMYGPEFLAQFGDDYSVFARKPGPEPPAPEGLPPEAPALPAE